MLHFYTPHFPERDSGEPHGSAICIPKNVFGAVRTSRQCNLYPQNVFGAIRTSRQCNFYTSIRPTSPSEIQEKYVMLHLYMPHFPERNSGKVCYVTFLYAPLPRAKFRKTSRQCNLYSQKRFWRSKNLKAVQFVPQKTFLAQ